MKVRELSIVGAYVLESPVWGDDRGYTREWLRQSDLEVANIDFSVAQANFSLSRRGVIRGLHYSLASRGQAKLVTCAHGELVDVIADVRVGSPTFGRVERVRMSADEGTSVLVPAKAAHGFCVTSEYAALTYLLSSPYDPSNEFEINPFDPDLAVAWPWGNDAVMSEKDAAGVSLAERKAANQLPLYDTL